MDRPCSPKEQQLGYQNRDDLGPEGKRSQEKAKEHLGVYSGEKERRTGMEQLQRRACC